VPRGKVAGATAALIDALAEQGVHVSRYQIERWRASGELPRPVRHGLGRGRGVASEPPDEQTVQTTLVLARSARRGSRGFGAHVIERLALGRPVAESDVRRAVNAVLDDIARMTGADVPGEDTGWQARQSIVARIPTRELAVAGWQDLLAAVDGEPERPELTRSRKRAAAAGFIHALGGGVEAVGDELIEMLGLLTRLTEDQAEQLRREQRDAELRGEDPWAGIAEQLSLQNLRRVAAAATLDELQRAAAAVATVAMIQVIVVLFGVLDLAGSRIDLDERLKRFDASMVRTLQADPMWPLASTVRLSPRPRARVRQLVLTSLGLLAARSLRPWEAYRDRLLDLYSYSPPHPAPDTSTGLY
jgi:hypothetical protein